MCACMHSYEVHLVDAPHVCGVQWCGCTGYNESAAAKDLDSRRVEALERIAEQLERIGDRLDGWNNRGNLEVVVHRGDG